MTQLHLIISGRVQGVNFRWFVMQNANAMSLTGFVRNLPDGTVEVMAYGEKERLEKLLAACRAGPRAARVEDIKIEWEEGNNVMCQFEIK